MNELILGLIVGLLGGLLVGLGLSQRLILQKGRGWNHNTRFKKPPTKVLNLPCTQLKPSQQLIERLHVRSLLIALRSDMVYPQQAIHTGLELALHSGQPLNFIVFLEVPRTHNLESGMEEELEGAFRLLERAERQAHQAGVAIHTSATKVRNYLLGVVDSALELKAGLIILEQFGEPHSVTQPGLAAQVNQLASKTGCNILLLTRATDQTKLLPVYS